jgi:hypothetical protein
MTVDANDRLSGPHLGNDVTTAFAYNWYILANTELRVILRDEDGEDVTQTLTTHYTVSGVGSDSGGNVTFVTAPPTGSKVIIEGVTPKTQTVDYENNDRFPYTSHQAGMDKIERQIQELQRDADRSVKFPHGETTYRLPVKPTSETKLLGRATTGELVHVDIADVSETALALGGGWLDLLGQDSSTTLDDLEGIRVKATYADLTSMPEGEFSAGDIICVYGRTTTNDGAFGFWLVVAGTAITANGGTVLTHDTLSFQFVRQHDGYVFIEAFGGKADTNVTDNALAVNRWADGVAAGYTPSHLIFRQGAYGFLTEPDDLEDLGPLKISGSAAWLKTALRQYYSPTDKTNAIFCFKGNSAGSQVENLSIMTADGYKGGSAIRFVATSSYAPSGFRLKNVQITTLSAKTVKSITSVTNNNPGVFTSAGHGLSNGAVVSLSSVSGGTFWQYEHKSFSVSDVTTDTFTLTDRDTSTKLDTTSLGSWSSGYVIECDAFEYPISIDGTAKSTGAIGIRVNVIEDCELFGGRRGVLEALGVETLIISKISVFSANRNWAIVIGGTAGVPSDQITIDGSGIGSLIMDRVSTVNVLCDIGGHVVDTANTSYFHHHLGQRQGEATTNGLTGTYGRNFGQLTGNQTFEFLAVDSLTGTPANKTFNNTYAAAPRCFAQRNSTVLGTVTTTNVPVSNASFSTDTILVIGELA